MPIGGTFVGPYPSIPMVVNLILKGNLELIAEYRKEGAIAEFE